MDRISKEIIKYLENNPGADKNDIVNAIKNKMDVHEREITFCINDLFFAGYIDGDSGYFFIEDEIYS